MAFFNKVRGNIIGVKFSKKEQEAIDREIHRQLLYAHRQSEIDDDCSLLWMLHEQFGFGYDRLKKAWELLYQANKEWEEHYELNPGDGTWVCRVKLKEYGVDVEQWYKEENLI